MKQQISQRMSLLSALFALPATAFTAWLVMKVLYKNTPWYEEFVTGYTSWTAYYKSGDMTLAYLVIGGILVFYTLFLLLFFLLSKKVSWLKGNLDVKSEYRPGWPLRMKRIEKGCFLFLFVQFSAASLLRTIDLILPGNGSVFGTYLYPIQAICGIAVLLFLYKYAKQKDERIMKRALEISQLFLPLCFLCISHYEYIREGVVITQYDSIKMKAVMAIAAIALVGYNFCRMIKDWEKEQGSIYISSFLSLAVFASYVLPRGTISGSPLEMYHYGEFSGPLHQLLNFGTVPYLDTMPIHGVCDYIQAGVWYTLFDGTYAAFEAAMVIGCVLIAVITAGITYYCVENKLAGLLCILLFSLFGDQYYYTRWAFVLPFILVLFSRKVREDFSKLLWYWTFISILSIAWNPSIGGACALAALPMILYEGIHEKGWRIFLSLKEKEGRRKLLPWYLPLFVLGICFIPMFFAILRYIVENSAAILETTGDILLEELVTPYVWYATFGFSFALLAACYFLTGKKGKDRKLAFYALSFLILFNAIIVKYTFIRTQFGERGIIVTAVSSLFLVLMIFLPYLRQRRSASTAVLACILFACVVWAKGANIAKLPGRIFECAEIPADYVYAPVEETGIPGLGDIYITEKQKTELMNLNDLANGLCKDGYQFVDMTNQLAHYNILNKKVLLPFSSTYNTNNRVMQTRAIEVLEELKPEVIAVWPAWEHDSGSLSTRNYYLYQYLAKNYVPCKYKNIIFLTNQEEIAKQYEPAYEELGSVMHIESLKRLPLVWGNEYLEEKETKDLSVSYSLIDTNMEETGENRYLLSAEENYIMCAFDEKLHGSEAPFLRIFVRDLSDSEEELDFEGVVYFMDEGESLKESHRFVFNGSEGEFLIPLTTSPYWSYSRDLQIFMVDFVDGSLPGKELEIRLEFEAMKSERN
ncbi:MAG: hypothetical protein HFI28_06875 [Lachnospiraceae bacterium]|jgi:hypothetical protein|nr:hypothetical protein [Lachnospiraceae bacterium]